MNTINEKTQELIERYIHNKMNKEECKDFENQIEKDSFLKENVELQLSIHKAFEDDSVINPNLDNSKRLEKIRKELKTSENQLISKNIYTTGNEYLNNKNKPFYKKIAAKKLFIAATFLMFLMIVWSNLNTNPNYYETYANWNDLPSSIEKNDSKNLMLKIEELYNSKKYQEVITEALKIKNPDSYNLIYLGASYVQLKEYKTAEQTFDKLIALNSLESSRGYWYKVLLYLKQEQMDNTNKTLKLIIQNNENYNYKQALELSEKLK